MGEILLSKAGVKNTQREQRKVKKCSENYFKKKKKLKINEVVAQRAKNAPKNEIKGKKLSRQEKRPGKVHTEEQ